MKDILQALLEILLVAAIVFAIGFVIITITDTHDKVDIIYKNLLLEEKTMTDKKCPQCGSRNFQICDEYVQELLYEVEEGRVIANGAGDGGEHIRTSCTCRNCGKHWHPRNLEYTIDE